VIMLLYMASVFSAAERFMFSSEPSDSTIPLIEVKHHFQFIEDHV
jgi:hypothetical protein